MDSGARDACHVSSLGFCPIGLSSPPICQAWPHAAYPIIAAIIPLSWGGVLNHGGHRGRALTGANQRVTEYSAPVTKASRVQALASRSQATAARGQTIKARDDALTARGSNIEVSESNVAGLTSRIPFSALSGRGQMFDQFSFCHSTTVLRTCLRISDLTST